MSPLRQGLLLFTPDYDLQSYRQDTLTGGVGAGLEPARPLTHDLVVRVYHFANPLRHLGSLHRLYAASWRPV